MGTVFNPKGRKMVKISIICLIYKSTKLADWVYESIMEYTPMLKNNEAEFFFVANDPTDEVIAHLIEKNYPFIINENKVLSEEELFSQGYGAPEYIGRVYRGYNQGILHAKGERVVLINSDNYFSPDWLENLIKYSEFKNVVSSQIVEPGDIEHGWFYHAALRANFGHTAEDFEKERFLQYAMQNKKTGLKRGGAFMPCIFYKDIALYAGLYPEGNIAGEDYNTIIRYGDVDLYERFMNLGIEHYTALDSISYHLQQGEKKEEDDNKAQINIDESVKSRYRIKPYNKFTNLKPSNLNVYLYTSATYNEIIKKLISNEIDYIYYYFRNKIVSKKSINVRKNKLLNFIALFIPIKKWRENFIKNIE